VFFKLLILPPVILKLREEVGDIELLLGCHNTSKLLTNIPFYHKVFFNICGNFNDFSLPIE